MLQIRLGISLCRDAQNKNHIASLTQKASMTTHHPELIKNAHASTDALATLVNISFSGIEQLTTLNLNAARDVLKEGAASSASLLKSKDAIDLQKLPNVLNSSTVELMSGYFRDIQKVASDTQQEFSSLMTSYFSELSKGATDGAGWAAGSDLFTKVSQQMTSMAEANAKAFTARGN